MSDEKMTDAEFAAKVDWEGGVLDALDYGLHAGHLANQSGELAAAWRELEQLWDGHVQPMLRRIEDLIEKLPSDPEEG